MKEPDEPLHCGQPGGASAWYSLLAEADGLLWVSTDGSDFDTVLAVYAGPENALGFDELTPVTCDDNSGPDGRTSQVTFAAKRNAVYHIAVDGAGGRAGRVRLAYRLSSAMQLQSAGVAREYPSGPAFRFVAAGLAGRQVVIEATTDLRQWLPVHTNSTQADSIEFVDPAMSLYPWRFYRAVVGR